MKPYSLFPLSFLLVLGVLAQSQSVVAQESDTARKALKQVKKAAQSSEVKSILADPRLRNMLRSVKDDSEGVAKSIQKNPDEAVETASSLFQEGMKKAGTNPRELNSRAVQAIEKLPKVSSPSSSIPLKEEPAVHRPARDANTETPPPTRAAAANSTAVSSMASPRPGTLAPHGGIVATSIPARPVAPGFSPSLVIGGNAPPIEVPDAEQLVLKTQPAPRPLKPGYSSRPRKRESSRQGLMEITARESVMDKKNRTIVFHGDVFVKSDADHITMKCDKLQIFLTPEGSNVKDVNGKPTQIKQAMATGGTVEIRKVTPEGKVQTALARRADYNAITKDAVLSGGPPSLIDGGSSIKTRSEDSKILLRGNGKYEVSSSERHTIVVPVKGGKKMDEDIGFGGSVENLKNQ